LSASSELFTQTSPGGAGSKSRDHHPKMHPQKDAPPRAHADDTHASLLYILDVWEGAPAVPAAPRSATRATAPVRDIEEGRKEGVGKRRDFLF
jgi:hypothetical protein